MKIQQISYRSLDSFDINHSRGTDLQRRPETSGGISRRRVLSGIGTGLLIAPVLSSCAGPSISSSLKTASRLIRATIASLKIIDDAIQLTLPALNPRNYLATFDLINSSYRTEEGNVLTALWERDIDTGEFAFLEKWEDFASVKPGKALGYGISRDILPSKEGCFLLLVKTELDEKNGIFS